MSILDISPVIPVVVLDDPESAVPLARALVDGGIRIIELTLRTPSALESMRRIAAEVPEIILGAGTVAAPKQAGEAAAAGATFLVSPGTTPTLLDAMQQTGLTLLPGCSSISEALVLRERGLTELKFFPAESAGGTAYLSALGGPLPDLRFCPTGGITVDTAAGYLALANVGCVGGSWLTPARSVAERDWDAVTEVARATVAALTS